ncbi:uncharacterized protein LOC127899798 [Citrus sinensis]|uniref:uncharacterized protein LOC127899798 n=1 Tax=Citrus sinensis TaxID=2711 RepID=UPI00227914F5|nr:uncharacterized protein LOC127899798 [Citrus sinensis]
MSKCKEKVVEIDDDELSFLPGLLTDPAFDPGIPLEPIRFSVGTSARRMSPQTTSTSGSNGEEGSSGSEDTLSENGEGDSGEVSPSGTSRPEERGTVGGRALSRDYAIDYMTCTTSFDELNDLRLRYSIPGEIPLKVPGKKDAPSRPPRGYVTLFLESFKYGLRCPLQPYFARILNGLNLAPGQLNPNGWRVLSVSWGVHFPLGPDQLKQVEAVLANSCSSRELLTTYNLLESRLILPGHRMEDAVIGALTRKRSRPPTTKRDQSKDAPTAKRANIVQQVPPLKILPSAPVKVGEASGAATDPAPSSPPVGPRSRLPDSRAEHMIPYLNELTKLVSKKDLEDFDGHTLGELVGAMQHSAFHLSCMTTYYKAKAAKEDAGGVEPIVVEEEDSPPRAVPADVGEASTPPDATGDTPPAPVEVQPTDAAGLTDPPSS